MDRDLSFKSEEVLDVIEQNQAGREMSDSIPSENISDDVNIASLVLNDVSKPVVKPEQQVSRIDPRVVGR